MKWREAADFRPLILNLDHMVDDFSQSNTLKEKKLSLIWHLCWVFKWHLSKGARYLWTQDGVHQPPLAYHAACSDFAIESQAQPGGLFFSNRRYSRREKMKKWFREDPCDAQRTAWNIGFMQTALKVRARLEGPTPLQAKAFESQQSSICLRFKSSCIDWLLVLHCYAFAYCLF